MCLSTTVKNRSNVWTKTLISCNIVARTCVYKQYVWCFCANNMQAITAQIHIKQVFLVVKPPLAFREFQTPSCISTELHASSSNRLHNFLRRHTTRPSPMCLSITVKNKSNVWTKTLISCDIVARTCVYKQYVWCFCTNNMQAITAQIRIKTGVLAVKPPLAFREFQTPSCISTELLASASNRLHNFLRRHTTRPSPTCLSTHHCKKQVQCMDKNAYFKRHCGENACLQAVCLVFLC